MVWALCQGRGLGIEFGLRIFHSLFFLVVHVACGTTGSPTRDQTSIPLVELWNLNHWTARKSWS